jgi:hypothetical protein
MVLALAASCVHLQSEHPYGDYGTPEWKADLAREQEEARRRLADPHFYDHVQPARPPEAQPARRTGGCVKVPDSKAVGGFAWDCTGRGEATAADNVAGPRTELVSRQALETSLELGRAIMRHAPQTYQENVDFSMRGTTTKRSDPTPEDLSKLREMLLDGANPNAVRVAGFEPAGDTVLDGGRAVRHSTGKPGRIVGAEEGGITLLEYCRLNGMKTIAALLIKHGAK